MNPCCQATDQHFDTKHAQKDLDRYTSKGPDPTTKALLSLLREAEVEVDRHLDVGGGIGVIAFELLSRGVASSTLIDASSSSLDVARTEAERRGVRHRMTIRHGDAVEETDALPAADLVTLDRVVCCYPYAERLLAASTSKAGAWYALSYPRNRWFVRLGVRVQNGWRTLQGHPFRTFVHDPTLIDTLIRRAGFARHSQRQTIAWQMVLYRRA